MEREIRMEAGRQYFKYFKIWFIIVGILAVIAGIVFLIQILETKTERSNTQAPAERVYDEADVLTTEEEERLRKLIAKVEEEIKADIILVTSNRIMEGEGAPSDASWEINMMNTADDFYDKNNYGYDMPRGNGLLLLDNWYEGQAGSWLSTCGTMIDEFSDYKINRVLDAVYYNIDNGAYKAYREGIEEIGNVMRRVQVNDGNFGLGAFAISTVTALIFLFVNLKNKEGKKTVVAGTYVEGAPLNNIRRDQFIRKTVVRRHIPRQSRSGGSSGRSSSGGGRSHRSSSGVSHGGGGRRR